MLPEKWDGKGEFPSDKAKYYGGYTQKDVKPKPDSPLQKLGIEKSAADHVTTAVLLDAQDAISAKARRWGPARDVTAERHRGDF